VATAQQIRLNQLLLEREALFVRIHACEQAAAKLLGEPYPFERPVLPSDQRGKRRPAAKPGGTGRELLRRLEPGEVAFRVVYQNSGRELIEEHDDVEALRVLLASQTAQLRVVRLETIDAAGAVVAVVLGVRA
jgi:hypothetical protein